MCVPVPILRIAMGCTCRVPCVLSTDLRLCLLFLLRFSSLSLAANLLAVPAFLPPFYLSVCLPACPSTDRPSFFYSLSFPFLLSFFLPSFLLCIHSSPFFSLSPLPPRPPSSLPSRTMIAAAAAPEGLVPQRQAPPPPRPSVSLGKAYKMKPGTGITAPHPRPNSMPCLSPAFSTHDSPTFLSSSLLDRDSVPLPPRAPPPKKGPPPPPQRPTRQNGAPYAQAHPSSSSGNNNSSSNSNSNNSHSNSNNSTSNSNSNSNSTNNGHSTGGGTYASVTSSSSTASPHLRLNTPRDSIRSNHSDNNLHLTSQSSSPKSTYSRSHQQYDSAEYSSSSNRSTFKGVFSNIVNSMSGSRSFWPRSL